MHEIPPPSPPPPLRVADWPLPPYRYIPGLHPHPFRHAEGHQYTDGSPPAEAPWSADTPWQSDRRYLRGLDLFDHRYLWEAHETWEGLWHFAPRFSADARLLQGLILAAAFVLKQHLEESEAAAKLLSRSHHHLGEALRLAGPHQRGLDLSRVQADLSAFATGGPWPLLSLSA